MPETDSVNAPEDGDVVAVSDAERRLRHYLADQDIGCPKCGYNLRGLEDDSCPECGERAELVLRLADARGALGALVVTIVGLSLTLGMTSLACFNILGFWIITGRLFHSIQLIVMQLIVFGFFVGTIIILVVVARRRGRAWFERRRRRSQKALAIAAWSTPLIYLAIVNLLAFLAVV